MFDRIIIIIMDSVGIGALPDAADYGDIGANTLANIARSQGGLFLPVLESLGLGCIEPIKGVRSNIEPRGAFGKMAEVSKGKDTTSGHWELAGCPVYTPFPVYPNGFPPEVIEKFSALTGRCILGNKAASGTAIIQELGAEHMRSGCPIVYTSADSVFQIAAHEEIIPLEELYRLCRIAREEVCVGPHAVGRVIARPFIGRPGSFTRTANRHDYSLPPSCDTILDLLVRAGYSVTGVGKIADIFAQRGITRSFPTKSNDDGMETLIKLVTTQSEKGVIMVNLVDFDSIYGHRRDPVGYARALEKFDRQLGVLLASLHSDDLLIITADHGCDPTFSGSDHTREYVPLIVYHRCIRGHSLGTRQSFADVAATVADNFSLPAPFGVSFLAEVK
ncbi:phosphopentomutase [Thermosinus carboxydivorans Nor1]|uniref:Phosphopentomutase n=1 Tax=Thermosinus carboxydivorans Nor1 TaxID=401526 RepID=A1HTQ2_9FIRM|nr:phosphopentomutase [Thermosinus carboxydivorans]EAX46602.1 phosphopentomutase [Thermosinus carboxydivorans Nor1]